MIKVAVYDTKPYDRQYLEKASESESIEWHFFDFRLNDQTAVTAKGMDAVCPFVNDQMDLSCLKILSQLGIKLIALRCAGYNNVDLAVVKSLNINLTRVPAYSPHSVAEYTIGLLLALNRKIHRAYNRIRELNFSLHGLIGFDIYGKTVGIIGAGKIGKIAAQILRGFGANVLVFDPYCDSDWVKEWGIKCVDFRTLLETSDMISLHVPLTSETFHLLDEHAFGLMKPGIFIINTSRGKVIETSALIKFLKNGHVGGVALDVYEEEEGIFFEDLSDRILLDDELSRLITFPNVLITSHQAFLTQEALREIAKTTIENILSIARKHPFIPETVLNEVKTQG